MNELFGEIIEKNTKHSFMLFHPLLPGFMARGKDRDDAYRNLPSALDQFSRAHQRMQEERERVIAKLTAA